MTAELGWDKGGLTVALDLRSGPAAGETGLLDFLQIPVDQVDERSRSQIQLGGDPWADRVVSILISISLFENLVHSKLSVFRIGA